MNEKKSIAMMWDAQSDATRIATGIAFAAAIAFMLYTLCMNLTHIHAMLYRVFETRTYAYEVFGTTAMAIIIATQLCVAILCAKARQKLEQGLDVSGVGDVGSGVLVACVMALTVLGFGVSIMLMDMPKTPASVEFTPLFFLALLNLVAVIILIVVSIFLLTDEHNNLPENPISVVGVITTGISVEYLALGFSVLNVALWAGAMALTLLLRPVGEAFNVARHKRQVQIIREGNNKPTHPVIEMGI